MVGVGRDLCGSPRAGCTGPCPGRSWISPEKETPQPPWAACSRAPSPSEGRSSSSCSDGTFYASVCKCHVVSVLQDCSIFCVCVKYVILQCSKIIFIVFSTLLKVELLLNNGMPEHIKASPVCCKKDFNVEKENKNLSFRICWWKQLSFQKCCLNQNSILNDNAFWWTFSLTTLKQSKSSNFALSHLP